MPKGNPKNPEIIREYWRQKQREYRERKKKQQEQNKQAIDILREAFATGEGEPNQ
jgi:uncharacterized membrane protein